MYEKGFGWSGRILLLVTLAAVCMPTSEATALEFLTENNLAWDAVIDFDLTPHTGSGPEGLERIGG